MARRGFFRKVPKISKRSRFVFSTAVLTLGLLCAFLFGPTYAYQSVTVVAFFSSALTLYSLWPDLPHKKQVLIILLPGVLFTLSAGLFYFVLPARWATRLVMLFIFSLGFYATLLVQNIYAISVSRSIKLLQAAKTIGFLLAVASAFGLYYIIFSLHTLLPFVTVGIFVISFLLIVSVIWSISLKEFLGKIDLLYTCILAFALTEIAMVLTFWPITVTFSAIFLAGNFYTLVGVSQHWLENRLFKRVLLEFLWVSIILFIILFFTAKWGG